MTELEAIQFIEYLIYEKRMTQSEVAEAIGINRVTVAEILSKKRKLFISTIRKIEWYRNKIAAKL